MRVFRAGESGSSRRHGTIVGFCFALMVLGVVLIPANTGSASLRPPPGSNYYEPAPPPPKGAEIVYVGIDPIQIFNLSLPDGTFQTSLYIWWRWKGSFDPTTSTEIWNSTASAANFSELWCYTNASGQETPDALGNGYRYQCARISTAIVEPFDLARYPLDNQELTVRIENNTDYFDQMVYVPDHANLPRHRNVQVAGWNVGGTSMHAYLHQYGTNFGLTNAGSGASAYSQLSYSVEISPPLSHTITKLFLPLLIILLVTLTILLVKDAQNLTRILSITVVGGLLTLVFLQQTYSSNLPPNAPVTLLDEIYGLAYIAIAIVFFRVVYITNQVRHHGRDLDAFVVSNRRIFIFTAAGFVIGAAILVVI